MSGVALCLLAAKNVSFYDKKCNSTTMTAFMIFEIGILILMQFVYFDAMGQTCHYNAPLKYFALMA